MIFSKPSFQQMDAMESNINKIWYVWRLLPKCLASLAVQLE